MHGIPSFAANVYPTCSHCGRPPCYHSERGEREIGFDSKKHSLSPVLEMIFSNYYGSATQRTG